MPSLPGPPPIEITLRRSARSTRFSLRVSQLDGRVTLSMPLRARERDAIEFARDHESWLRTALARRPDAALLHYNLAIALEDARRETDALAAYERCLALAPSMADAHYNAARLHEKLGDRQAALRHYSAYRRLQS